MYCHTFGISPATIQQVSQVKRLARLGKESSPASPKALLVVVVLYTYFILTHVKQFTYL